MGRAERLTAGLASLWPAPLTASLIADPIWCNCAVTDEAGHARREWQELLRPHLLQWAEQKGPVGPTAAPAELNLPDHLLHGGVVAWEGRQYGSVGLALHKRTTDAPVAQALLTHVADHLGFQLFQEEAERQRQIRYRDLADLTTLVGHEFNNVLNSVGLQVAALGQKGLTGDDFPELAEVRMQVAAAGQMVWRLQDYCLKGSSPREPTDLNRAVRAAAAHPSLCNRVRLELAAELPAIQGTALDTERLAGALMRGACAATEPGLGLVTVGTGKGTGSMVWLRVEDTGSDPEDALLPRLFEPFVPVREGDDGVVLALAKAIGRRLGGNLRGERRIGGGMVFVAELRAAE